MTNLPAPEDVAGMTGLLRERPQWSVFWDPKYHLWRAAEDESNSEIPDAATIMEYITAHPKPAAMTESAGLLDELPTTLWSSAGDRGGERRLWHDRAAG